MPIIRFYSFFILVALFTVSCTSENHEEEAKGVADDWFFAQRAYPSGKIDKDSYYQAISDRKNQVQLRSNLNWEFEGPLNVGGRLTDVEMPIDDQNTIYVGAASGGIFKSEDFGLSWESIFNYSESLSIGDIEISKTNTDVILVGTGESNAGGSSLAYDGYGVYRSTDAGDSWFHLGLEDVGSIGKVALDPTDDDIIFVAAMGDLFGNNAERGIYRSTNGGDDWEQVLFVSDSTGFVDLAINPDNPDIIYAAAWERIRRVDFRQYGGETGGLYRSQDGGDTWEELTNGLPTTGPEKGRIGIGLAASNPDIIYLHYAAANGNLRGIFKTINGGENWYEVSKAGIDDVPYMWWFGRIEVDPTDADRVFFIGLNNHESTNGGASWSSVFQDVHVDQHAIFIHPENPELVLNGNDGGLYVSTTGGDQYEFRNNLPITQIYTLDFDPTLPQRLYTGTQDNGTNRTLSGNTDDWSWIFGGDGFHSLVDPNNNQTIFVEYQNGNLFKSTNNGLSWQSALGGINSSDRRNWKTPYMFDPANSNIMYLGANTVKKSLDQGDSWFSISPDLTNGPGSGNLQYGTITTLSVSPLNSDVIYAGTDDGNLWVTKNGGNDWDKISDDLPNRWVTKVLASSYYENEVYVTFSGFRFGEYEGHVYKSFNQGTDWQDISYNLGDIPVNDIAEVSDNPTLIAATDVGVFYMDVSHIGWGPLGEGLPNVVVSELTYAEDINLLYAGTYGRSAYSIDLEQLFTSTGSVKNAKWSVYPTLVMDKIHVESSVKLTEEHSMRLISITGEVLHEGKLNEMEGLDYSGLKKGVLILEVYEGSNRIHVERLIKL
jgi:photosystem II stability/assembly factor-like uncharacterized protein